MTKDQRIDKAIEIVSQADFQLGEALRMLNGACPLAADHIVEAQGQCLDAVIHMETRPLVRKLIRQLKNISGKGLTTFRKRGIVSA